MDVFFSDDGRYAYLHLLSELGRRSGISFLAWCLITNLKFPAMFAPKSVDNTDGIEH